MKKRIGALIRLARYKEYIFFVAVTTLLGVASAQGTFGWKFIIVLIANWLAVGFAFMINDVEDAPDDALNPLKVKRNPVSAGDLSHRDGYWASAVVAVLSAIFYAFLGLWPFILGIISLALGFFYSWRPFRLKNIAILDMLSHCMMLAGMQFLPAFIAFGGSSSLEWLFPFFFVVCVSLYGELFNEMRDLEGDLKAGLRHTGAVLGSRPTNILMLIVLSIGVICGGITFLILKIIPTWVLVVMAITAFLLLILPAIRARKQKSYIAMQESFQKPLEIAAAVALSLQFIWPWIYKFFGVYLNWFYILLARVGLTLP